ncbi:STAS domain-containing protein [bacterium]|nr:STAS domain-containing protein [bacterium]
MVIFEEQGDVLVVSLVGEMTISRISLFKDKIDAYNIDQFHKIAVNLEKLSFIDSSGLGTLVLLIKEVKSNYGTVVLASPQNQVNKLLDMVKINKYVEIKPTMEEAIQFLQSQGA